MDKQLLEKIKKAAGRENRQAGNVNEGWVEQEIGRLGGKPKPDDIPTQDRKVLGRKISGSVAPGSYAPPARIVDYQVGQPRRPPISHDSGFSKFPKESPGLQDYLMYAKWVMMAEGAAALRPDLTDGIAAYRHFLGATGGEANALLRALH